MTCTRLSRRVLPRAVVFALLAFTVPWTVKSAANDDVLARCRAMYASLRSYADTGVVLSEYGSSSKDRHAFTTHISRAPRRFYFDFKKDAGDRFVMWGDPDAFHTWWKTTGVQDDYPNPNNVGAFSTAGAHTAGSAMKIPTLWFSNAGLQGPFATFTDSVLDGTEVIGGRRCHRLVGTARDVYGTGYAVNSRKVTVWIDAESLLIRKVLEEWTPLPGQVNRTTTTFDPQANPSLDDSRFRFIPPASK